MCPIRAPSAVVSGGALIAAAQAFRCGKAAGQQTYPCAFDIALDTGHLTGKSQTAAALARRSW